MHPSQVQPLNRSPLARRLTISQAAVLGSVLALFAGVWRRRARATGSLPGYQGHAWCDSIERQLITDTIGNRRPSL